MLQPTTIGRRVRAHVRGQAVGYLALFVALGGTSYAAVKLPRNSVHAKQIAANAVGHSELRPHAVGASDLHAGAVTGAALAPGAVTAASILRHQVGTEQIADEAITNPKLAADAVDARTVGDGAIGASELVDGGVGTSEIADGAVTPAKLDDTTAARVRGWEIVTAHTANTKSTISGIGARCPAGKQVLGGGGHIDQAVPLADNATEGSYPDRFVDGTSGFHFSARWNSPPGSGWSVTAYAICAVVSR
ncbi:MAG: hypothetical protein ABI611_21010 [Solirubrobacteraceae bacterium]